MKKVIVLIATLLFASTASAENETENLSFTLTDVIPDPSITSSANETIFDPKTGTAIIPALMVSGEGDSPDKIYSLELLQTEELSFEVTQLQDQDASTLTTKINTPKSGRPVKCQQTRYYRGSFPYTQIGCFQGSCPVGWSFYRIPHSCITVNGITSC